jgi:hypothetical protein
MFCLFLLYATAVEAQGIYNNNNDKAGGNSSGSAPGLRAGPPDSGGTTPGGNTGDTGGTDPGKDSDPTLPVGEGLLILTLLSGGYAVIKKRNKKNDI